MIATPPWLYDAFGVAMLLVAATSLFRLVSGVVQRRSGGWDVDGAHLFMGIAMAGMFVEDWMVGSDVFWELVFGVFLVWFFFATIQSLQTFGAHLSHYAIHATMSLVMLIMYWFPQPMGTSSSMAARSLGVGHRPDPGLVLVLAVILLASAIRVVGSEQRGVAAYGRQHCAPPVAATATSSGLVSTQGSLRRVVAHPAVGDATHVVMCVAMAFMLILMI